jgi:hypothetical protein
MGIPSSTFTTRIADFAQSAAAFRSGYRTGTKLCQWNLRRRWAAPWMKPVPVFSCDVDSAFAGAQRQTIFNHI